MNECVLCSTSPHHQPIARSLVDGLYATKATSGTLSVVAFVETFKKYTVDHFSPKWAVFGHCVKMICETANAPDVAQVSTLAAEPNRFAAGSGNINAMRPGPHLSLIQSLRAFRRPQIGGLEAWRLRGLDVTRPTGTVMFESSMKIGTDLAQVQFAEVGDAVLGAFERLLGSLRFGNPQESLRGAPIM